MSTAQDFVVFWSHYPRRVGKLAAQKAYDRARKRGVTQQQLLDGIARYLQHKPAYADWCHPATWLNQGRWDDEYETSPAVASLDWWDECKQLHGGACGARYAHSVRMQLDSYKAGAKL